jgi:hypothetical protein
MVSEVLLAFGLGDDLRLQHVCLAHQRHRGPPNLMVDHVDHGAHESWFSVNESDTESNGFLIEIAIWGVQSC